MRSTSLSVCCLLVAATFLAGSHSVSAQFEQLVSKVPAAANAIVLLNVEKVLSSPVAVKENWKTAHDKSYAAGLSFLPPDSRATVLAAQLNLDELHPLWTVAVVETDHEPSLALIERMTGGTMEKMGSYSVVDLQGNGYLVQFGPQLVAAMAPTNRQGIGRWIREVDSSPAHRLSPYLAEAFGYANQIGTPVVIAMDLQDAAKATDIRAALTESGSSYASAPPETVERLVKLLTSIRGITLGITLGTDRPFGKVRVDFGEPVSMSPTESKAMLLRALEKRGAMLEELDDWTPEVNGRVVTLEGYLTSSGIKRISSLFDRPPAFKKGTEVTSVQTVEPGQQQSNVQSTKAYFDHVLDLFEDLKKTKRQSRNYTMGLIGTWCNNYARKIDQLPSVGVDPEMVNYGAYVSDALRAINSSIKTAAARKTVRQVNTSVPYDYYNYSHTYGAAVTWAGGIVPYGNWGTVAVPDYRAYQQARTAVSAEERVTSATQSRDIQAKIEEATGDIRRKMSMKYGTNF